MTIQTASHAVRVSDNQERISQSVIGLAGFIASASSLTDVLANEALYIAEDPDAIFDSFYNNRQSEKIKDVYQALRKLRRKLDATHDVVSAETQQDKDAAIATLKDTPYNADYSDIYPQLV